VDIKISCQLFSYLTILIPIFIILNLNNYKYNINILINNRYFNLLLIKYKLSIDKLSIDILFNIKIKNNVLETRLTIWDPYLINYNIKDLYNYNSITYHKNKWNKLTINNFIFNLYQKSILIGILLSDAWIKRSSKNPYYNYIIEIKQSLINSQYIWYIWFILGNIISGEPKLRYNLLRTKLFSSLLITTKAFKENTKIAHDLFYDNNYNKIIKEELYHYFNIISLAHIIIGDGSSLNGGITICTDNYSYKDVVLIINILKLKFDLNCTIHYSKYRNFEGTKLLVLTDKINQIKLGKPRIYIPKGELLKIKQELKIFICPHFYYKIGK